MIPHPERLPERDTAILAMLPNVAFDGWTKRALRAGIAHAGMPADEADLLFPLGTVDMIETFCDLADRRMEEAAATLTPTKTSARVRAVIALAARAEPAIQGSHSARVGGFGTSAKCPDGGRLHCSDSRRHLARRRRPFRRLQLVHQARDPDHDLQRDHPVLAA